MAHIQCCSRICMLLMRRAQACTGMQPDLLRLLLAAAMLPGQAVSLLVAASLLKLRLHL